MWPRQNDNNNRGEAAQTIAEECERLFCDTLSVLFLGERNGRHRTSLAMGANDYKNYNDYNNYQQDNPVRPGIQNRKRGGQQQPSIDAYIELWDYANDAIYRGFVANGAGHRTLFVFFDSHTTNHGIKTALLALFELAEMEAFECSQVIACVPRSDNPMGLGIVRSLGWCGFSLTSLDAWMAGPGESALSDQWLFLAAQI